MSIKMSTAVWEQFQAAALKTSRGATVSGSVCKLVLLALADYADDEGGGIYPSVTTICERTLLSRRAVINALDALKTTGVIAVSERSSRYGTNSYTINSLSLKNSEETLRNSDGAGSAPGAPGWCTWCTSAGAPRAPDPLVNPLVNPCADAEQKQLSACARVVDDATTDTPHPQQQPQTDPLSQTRETMQRLASRGGVGMDWAVLAGGPVRQVTPEQQLANEIANAAQALPPDCRGLATAYMTATGHVLQLPHVRRDTRAFREMLRDEVTPDTLSATIALMRRQGLAIAAPYSVIGMARDQAAQRARQQVAPAVPEIPQAVGIERIEEGRRRLAAVFGRG